MTATDILEMALAAGMELTAEGDKLACRAPKGAVTPELRGLLAEHKAEVLELLKGDASRNTDFDTDTRMYALQKGG